MNRTTRRSNAIVYTKRETRERVGSRDQPVRCAAGCGWDTTEGSKGARTAASSSLELESTTGYTTGESRCPVITAARERWRTCTCTPASERNTAGSGRTLPMGSGGWGRGRRARERRAVLGVDHASRVSGRQLVTGDEEYSSGARIIPPSRNTVRRGVARGRRLKGHERRGRLPSAVGGFIET